MKVLIIGNKKNIIRNVVMDILIIASIIYLTFYLASNINIKLSKAKTNHHNSTYVNMNKLKIHSCNRSFTDLIEFTIKSK